MSVVIMSAIYFHIQRQELEEGEPRKLVVRSRASVHSVVGGWSKGFLAVLTRCRNTSIAMGTYSRRLLGHGNGRERSKNMVRYRCPGVSEPIFLL